MFEIRGMKIRIREDVNSAINSLNNSAFFDERKSMNLPTIENSEREVPFENYKINRANIGTLSFK